MSWQCSFFFFFFSKFLLPSFSISIIFFNVPFPLCINFPFPFSHTNMVTIITVSKARKKISLINSLMLCARDSTQWFPHPIYSYFKRTIEEMRCLEQRNQTITERGVPDIRPADLLLTCKRYLPSTPQGLWLTTHAWSPPCQKLKNTWKPSRCCCW